METRELGVNGLVLAAAHIEDAKAGGSSYGKASYYFKSRHLQICFKIITNSKFQRVLYMNVLVHSLLTFLEPPSVSAHSVQTYIALVLNLLCLALYLVDIILAIVYLSPKVFWCHENYFWNRVEFILFCGFITDWILLLAQAISGNKEIVQPFRCCRPAIIVCKARNIGHIYNVVKSITLKLGGIILIVFFFILVYSGVGVHLFMETYAQINHTTFQAQENDTNSSLSCSIKSNTVYEGTYDNIGIGALRLFVLLTTENYPLIVFPAYHKSEWYFAYFGSYVFFGVFLLTAIVLAIITDLYWEYNKKHVKKERSRQRAELVKAWKILDPMGEEEILSDDPNLLQLFRILKPKNTDEDNMELINELDPDQSGYINWIQWVTQLLNILDLESTSQNDMQRRKIKSPRCVKKISMFSKKITSCTYFEKVVLLFIMLHSVLFGLKWKTMPVEAEIAIQGLRTAIVLIFVLEMILRISGNIYSFFTIYLDTADLFLVVIATLSNLVWYGSLAPDVDSFTWRGFAVVISSVAIFIRLVLNSSHSRQVLAVCLRLFPVMRDLIVLFAIVIYFYAVIGMEAFHGFDIQPSSQYADHFQYNCGIGFRNFRCSLLIVFQIVGGNNWNDIMNSVISNLNSFGPVVYFLTCYIVLNILIMNLLLAIGIEAFHKFSQDQELKSMEDKQAVASSGEEETNQENAQLKYGMKWWYRIKQAAISVFSSARVMENGIEDVKSLASLGSRSIRRGRGTYCRTRRVSSSDSTSSNSNQRVLSSGAYSSATEETSISLTQRQSSSLSVARTDTISSFGEESIYFPLTGSTHSSSVLPSDTASVATISTSASITPSSASSERPRNITDRKEMIARKLREQQRIKKSKLIASSMSSASLASNVSEDIPKGGESSKPGWVPVTYAIQVSNDVAKTAQHNKPIVESHNQIDGGISQLKISTGASLKNSKFRRSFDPANWRAQVQNLTIMNKEELVELRRQMSSARFSLPRSPTKLAVGEEKNSKKANESSAIKKLETMSELPNEDAVSVVDMEAESNRETSKAEKDERVRRRSVTCSLGSIAKLVPMIAVDEGSLTELKDGAALTGMQDTMSLAVPQQSKPKSQKPSTDGRVPGWAVRLAQEYNVTLNTELEEADASTSSTIEL